MNINLHFESLAKALKQRNFSYMMSGFLLLANLFLTLKVYHQEDKWVLIPQFDIDHHTPVNSASYSPEYLTDWADSMSRNLLTANPSTVERRVQEVLRVAAGTHNGLKEKLMKQAHRQREEQISTAFYPKAFEVFPHKQEVRVRGEFQSYFGRGKEPISRQRTYILKWVKGPRHVLLIDDFYEVKDADPT